jgi:hypothetical protein
MTGQSSDAQQLLAGAMSISRSRSRSRAPLEQEDSPPSAHGGIQKWRVELSNLPSRTLGRVQTFSQNALRLDGEGSTLDDRLGAGDEQVVIRV